MSSSPEVDKDQLYGEFQRGQQWREKLSRKLAHKSLDIADDEMQINVDRSTRSGMGVKELLAMCALVAGGAAGGAMLQQERQTTPQPTPAVESNDTDTDTDTDTITVLEFVDSNNEGN
jgi:hypothetical protein